jgi:hypothetical protein
VAPSVTVIGVNVMASFAWCAHALRGGASA